MNLTLGVLTLNNWKYTKAFLETIDADVDVLVLDNGSNDGTPELARQVIIPGTGKPPRVVSMGRNAGVAAGWNALLQNSDSETLIISNNDILLKPGTITDLHHAHRRLGAAVTSGWRTSDPREPWRWGLGADYGFFAMDRYMWQHHPFDETYWPAYYEDCDHTIQLARAGLSTVRSYGSVFECPLGSRTINEGVSGAQLEEMKRGMEKNGDTFAARYGTKDASAAIASAVSQALSSHPLYLAHQYACEASMPGHPQFDRVADFSQHVETVHDLAWQCDHVTEMGVRTGVSTAGILAARPRKHVAYDIFEQRQVAMLAASAGTTEFVFRNEDVLGVDIEPTDMLFIDTLHVYRQLAAELARHGSKARKWIVLHDTVSFGQRGEDGSEPGLMQAVHEFVANGDFFIERHDEWCNGLMILRRVGT